MTQLQKTAGRAVSMSGRSHLIARGRQAFVYIAFAMVVVAIAAMALLIVRPPAPSAAPAPDAAVTDGWLPAITAANEARGLEEAQRTVDGWSSQLLVQPAAAEVTDGWASRYLVADDN